MGNFVRVELRRPKALYAQEGRAPKSAPPTPDKAASSENTEKKQGQS